MTSCTHRVAKTVEREREKIIIIIKIFHFGSIETIQFTVSSIHKNFCRQWRARAFAWKYGRNRALLLSLLKATRIARKINFNALSFTQFLVRSAFGLKTTSETPSNHQKKKKKELITRFHWNKTQWRYVFFCSRFPFIRPQPVVIVEH